MEEVGRGRDGGGRLHMTSGACKGRPGKWMLGTFDLLKGRQSLVPTKTHPEGNSPYTEMEFSHL